ncbi:MAG: polyribonucleotide nucleotidyltransferase [Candidatus Kaiserbacteria bacterium]|nr:polyribonucleotide nucleotidyltransferase [Candidatus Kaiserbacteria bacterium]MCB9816526.1 polyribonucleotide nucleotidyltransferase [Candidatus Nomurabacteria bacterium]
MQTQSFSLDLAGKTLTAEFSDLTAQANGSVLLKYGETAILVTAVMGEKEVPMNYFPLSVEFEEKFYAAGAILGSRFQRREGRPSDEAVLSARIVDRTIRPLFNQHIRKEVQVVVTVLAIGEDDPDVLGVIGASLALAVSDIPWRGPVGAVRIGRNKETREVIINPTYNERKEGLLDFEVLACGKDNTINMIETAAHEVSETDVVAILEAATSVHQQLEQWQKEIVAALGKDKQAEPVREIPEALVDLFTTTFKQKLSDTLFSNKAGKSHIYELKGEFMTAVDEREIDAVVAGDYFEDKVDEELHRGALEDGKRADGRGMDEVRELFAKAGGVSPVLHGSGIFYRGGTHIFSALTLGGPEAAQAIDTIESQDMKKRFMHHYNFPPFSVGETGRVGGFNRRMIGHGALAEKALVPVLPSQEEFPYTIRLVSETLSSNGSSSMGSVCGSTLALMDGGVPIKRPVAGIASGVMIGGDQHVLLTDIQGPEDEFGDMDFKVAGTTEGVTAIQMDVKVDGVPLHILEGALEKARQARLQILDVITAEIAVPRENISPRAPEIIVLKIMPEQIGLVIGSGGKTINSIKDDSGVEEIGIEEDGTVYITGKNGTAQAAADRIRALTRVYEVGERAEATVTRIATFGAFAKLDAFNEGLIHISEVAPFRIETVEGILNIGDVVPVVISKVEDGKIGLSIKQADPEWGKNHGLTPQARPEKKQE